MLKRSCILAVAVLVSVVWGELAGTQTVVDSFPSPGNQTRGLAWDGSFLWNADAEDTVYRIDPSTGEVVSSFYFPIDSAYGGITWGLDNSLWIANGRIIYKVNPTTGDILYSFECPGG